MTSAYNKSIFIMNVQPFV